MFEYILECGDEQLLNTTLSAKAQIYLLLHLVCRVDREILDDIYNMKRKMEDIEKRETLVYNKHKYKDVYNYDINITTQINALYPYYIMYNGRRLYPLNTKYTDNISGVYILNLINKYLKQHYKNKTKSINTTYYSLHVFINMFKTLMRDTYIKNTIKITDNNTRYGISINTIYKSKNERDALYISLPPNVFGDIFPKFHVLPKNYLSINLLQT